MNENKIIKYIDNISLDEVSKQRILKNIMSEENKKNSISILKVLIVACIVISITIPIVTANHNSLNDMFRNFLSISNIEEEQINILTENLNISCTENDVTINIVQSISDEQTMYIIYEILTPDDIILNENNSFENILVSFDPIINNSYYSHILSDEKNKRTEMLIFDSSHNIDNYDISIKFSNLILQNEIISDNWNLEWNINNMIKNNIIYINENIEIEDGMFFYINNISISPLSSSIEMNSAILPEEFAGIDFILNTTNGDVNLRSNPSNRTIYITADKGECHYFRFENIIDVTSVKGLTIGEKYIDFKN